MARNISFGGLSVGMDSDGHIDDIVYKRRVVAKTADYTVLAAESGTFFTTEGATAAVNFTLPAFADGLEFEFYNAEDVNLTVTSGTADLMVASNDVAADSVAFSTTSLKAGGSFKVVSDGVKWFAQVLSDGNTVTIATA